MSEFGQKFLFRAFLGTSLMLSSVGHKLQFLDICSTLLQKYLHILSTSYNEYLLQLISVLSVKCQGLNVKEFANGWQ